MQICGYAKQKKKKKISKFLMDNTQNKYISALVNGFIDSEM